MLPIIENFENNTLSETDEQVVDALRVLVLIDHGPLLDMELEEKKLIYKRELKQHFKKFFEELDSDEAFEVRKRFEEYSTLLFLSIDQDF
ncbi:hypothetical protein F1880_008408 [Penicillium rolfsii]|nr:hypothetical protein F1880_008408 [Penicillium rolfsii]